MVRLGGHGLFWIYFVECIRFFFGFVHEFPRWVQSYGAMFILKLSPVGPKSRYEILLSGEDFELR